MKGSRCKCSATSVDVGTRVRFMSDYGTVTGVVVITLGGLYGIYTDGYEGLFWRDRKALKVLKNPIKPRRGYVRHRNRGRRRISKNIK